jgi:hypothetical protein
MVTRPGQTNRGADGVPEIQLVDATGSASHVLATPLRDEDRGAKPFELPIANHAAIL